jgi:hypothetical protein
LKWPTYKENKPTVMVLKSNPSTGLWPNLDKIKTIDEYFAFKRSTEEIEK